VEYLELKLSAQTAYAELFEQSCSLEKTNALAGLSGSFQKLERKGKFYWYFAYRDIDQKTKLAYVGPDEVRVQALVAKFAEIRQHKPLAPLARSATALGCTPFPPKHFRIIKRLSEYGFFRAGAVLIGTHAFLAIGNMLGVRWLDGAGTLGKTFAYAGHNISVALPASFKLDVHGARESLESGLLPISQFNGSTGAQVRDPKGREASIAFVTSVATHNKPAALPNLNIALESLRSIEFCFEQTTQGCVFANAGACEVNLPAPERFAIHRLIVYEERPGRDGVEARNDLLQAASLANYFSQNGQADLFNSAWRDALSRDADWRERAIQGRDALLNLVPDLAISELWAE
jgi:hypothetical protein